MIALSSERAAAGADRTRFGPLQFGVTALCAVVALLDGFDTQAIAYVAPRIAQDWGTAPSAFGPVFAVGLLGLSVGALVVSPMADRFGRKTIVLLSTLVFGLFALLTATAESMNALLVYRFLTGIGLGAAMPNIVALTSEYAPERLRATLVTVMFCGFPLGSTLGGLVSTGLIDAFGWRSVFVLGGALPLLLTPVLVWLLPESARFLVATGAPERRIASIASRLDPTISTATFIAQLKSETVEAPKGLSIFQLFTAGRARVTVLLWLAFFMNLLVMYFLVNWLPTLLKAAGLSLAMAILPTATLNLGGVVGGVVLGRLIDRWGPYAVLGGAYTTSAGFIALIAMSGENLPMLIVGAALAGFGVVGGQIGAIALAASVYPTAIRATGLGWAFGIGRIGAIIGPLLGGLLLAQHWAPKTIILTAVGPALLAAAAVFLLGRVRKTPGVQVKP
jgi:AAHS family 4-hydroxybenzoate transporter-like MFS transporter